MRTDRFITILLMAFVSLEIIARNHPDYPRAQIRVEYNYHEKFLRGSEVVERDIPMMLYASGSFSKFYSPHTEYKDSLESTPSGRAKSKEILHAAIRSKDYSVLDATAYKTFIYVFKDVSKSLVTVYDKAGLTDYGCYTEPFHEQQWQLCDSIREIIGYQCQMAQMDYHGRRRTVWFAPEIPLQDGPWKFFGLPGLILEASEPSRQHYFVAKGIDNFDKDIVPVYDLGKYEKMSRKDLLRGRRNSIDNGSSILRAQTGIDLGVDDGPLTKEKFNYDFLETDYH